MGIPATLALAGGPGDPCANSPTITVGPTLTTTQEPTCANDGLWTTRLDLTVSSQLSGSDYEIGWFYTTASSGTSGWTQDGAWEQPSGTSLQHTFPDHSYGDPRWGTDGDGPSQQTIYMKGRAQIKHVDHSGICEDEQSSQSNRVVKEGCAA